MGLLSDLQAFKEKALEAASTKTNLIVEDLFTQAVILSPSPSNPGPYARGLLVNQWYASSGASYSTEVGSTTSDVGTDSLARIKALVNEHLFYGRDNTVSLSNNTEEAIYADKLGWAKGSGTNGWHWKGTAPHYMTSNAVNNVLSKYS